MLTCVVISSAVKRSAGAALAQHILCDEDNYFSPLGKTFRLTLKLENNELPRSVLT